MAARWVSGAVSAAMTLMVCTLVPNNDASAAERVVKPKSERSAVAATRRAERQARREAPAPPPVKKPTPDAAKDDDASWVSIYPAER